jgi:Tol biopolymer transport system component
MTLAPGTRLGTYEITARLGAGGMGEVYRAGDSRLGREVAIKVLPEAVAADPERLARFEREAKVLASLNHPNIAAIYSFEKARVGQGAPLHFLVLELAPGETLADRLARGPLPPDETLAVGLQIAQAIEEAHEKGIVHRDLKPANVKLAPDGKVKVLDFGLAKAVAGGGDDFSGASVADSPTVTYGATQAGVILGSAAYMAPEQARGKPADRRADIWAYGVVLFECLTGKRLFGGETITETLAAVMRDEPDLSLLPAGTPHSVRELIVHCLVKDPRHRLQAIGDARIALEEALARPHGERPAGDGQTAAAAPVRTTSMGRRALLTCVLALAAGFAGWLLARSTGAPGASASAPLRPVFRQLTKLPGGELWPSLAPDGESFLFVKADGGDYDVFLQRVDGRNAINLTPDCALGDRDPAFSPDGRAIAFHSDCGGGGIFVMGATGEALRRVTDFGYQPAWSPDGSRLAVVSESLDLPTSRLSTSRLSAIDLASGTVRRLTDGFDAMGPTWSPDGGRIAFWGLRENTVQRDLWTVAADGSESSPERPPALTDDPAVDWAPAWSPAGDWLYFASSRGGTFNFWRARVAAADGRLLAGPEPVTAPSSWAGPLSISRDGRRFAFVDRNAATSLFRALLDLPGRRLAGPPVPVIEGSFECREQALSPDGEWIAFTNEDLPQHLHLVRADGTGYRQLTDGPDRNRQASWSPDGKRLAFQTSRGPSSLAVVGADGAGWQSIPVTFSISEPRWSPDGATITVFDTARGGWLVDLGPGLGAPDLRPLPAIEPGVIFWPLSWSNDGRLLGGLSVRHGNVDGQYVLSVAAGEYRRLGSVTEALGFARSAFDGAPIFVDDRRYVYAEGRGLYLGDLAGGEPTLLHETLPGHVISSVSPSADGRWLTWVDRADESDIWLMTLEEQLE